MEFKLNIEEILTSDEIKEIAVEQVRLYFRAQTEQDLKRIMSNCGYKISSMIIDEALVSDENIKVLKRTIDEIFSKKETISFNLLRKPDAWDRSETTVHKVFTEAVIANSELIRENAKKAISDLNAKDFKQWIITAKHNNWI